MIYTLTEGLKSATPTIVGTSITYERLVAPDVTPADVTITINGVTRQTTNAPTVDADGYPSVDLTQAEEVAGARLNFIDTDRAWLDTRVTLNGGTIIVYLETVIAELRIVRGDHYDGIHGPRLMWKTVRTYDAAIAKLIIFSGPTVLGQGTGTADGNMVTITDFVADFDPSLFRGCPSTAKLDYAVVVVDGSGEYTERFGACIVSFRADVEA